MEGNARNGGWRGLVEVVEQWELTNKQPKYNFVVRKHAIGKDYSVSVLGRGGELDTTWGFETEYDALVWVKEKSAVWLQAQAKR